MTWNPHLIQRYGIRRSLLEKHKTVTREDYLVIHDGSSVGSFLQAHHHRVRVAQVPPRFPATTSIFLAISWHGSLSSDVRAKAWVHGNRSTSLRSALFTPLRGVGFVATVS